MSQTFTDCLAIVRFLISTQRLPLENAIRQAKVPLHLVDAVRSYFTEPVDIQRPSILFDTSADQVPLCEPLADDKPQPYWSGFSGFLLNERRWSRGVVETLDTTSLDLLRRIPRPDSAADFRSRGLVVGYIQSGKTANMAALIARAADQGYKLFIILAGLYNDLRAQTQRRLDQEITGSSPDPRDRPLVAHEPGAWPWVRLTDAGLGGEFQLGTHVDLHPNTPKLAVLKKNVRVMERLIEWLSRSPVSMRGFPAIVIDDEADQASINTKYGMVDDDGNPIDPSATNQRIRDLLALLPKCVYVGFTATPFANVLVDVDEHDDLYPRNFIACLPEPNGYLGPRQLFGLGMVPSGMSPEPPEEPELDVIRSVTMNDLQDVARLGTDCPDLIERSILSYILSCCARVERGQDREHFSMFIHPSYATLLQEIFTGIVQTQINYLRVAVARPKQFGDLIRRVREMWESDFTRVTSAQSGGGDLVRPFDSIWRHSKAIVDAIDIKTLNYNSFDELDYAVGAARRYIIIGGNRLSRGLTLEGLSTSVFLRDTPYYDTLLQMGRWFGYRRGYADLTRIYVEDRMADQFADLARVELELRSDLARYATVENPPTPVDVMPIIRAHPVMLITARNKLGAGKMVSLSLAGQPRETVSFPDDFDHIKRNLQTAKAFVQALGEPARSLARDGMHLWSGVQATEILTFIDSYVFGAEAQVVNRTVLSSYIRGCIERGELGQWDIAIPAGNPDRDLVTWAAGVSSHKVKRSPHTRHSIGVLRNPGDLRTWQKELKRGLDDPSIGCLMLYAVDKESTSKSGIRFYDDPAQGEDIVGLLLAFPRPKAFVPVPYISQQGRV